jgi:CBS domain-containing protein
MDRLHLEAALECDVPTVRAEAPLARVLSAAAATRHAQVAVVGLDGELVGLVTHHEVREALLARGALDPLLVAEDLAVPVEPLRPGQTLRDALAAMNARGLDAIPVVTRDEVEPRFMGLLTRAGLLRAYERALTHSV